MGSWNQRTRTGMKLLTLILCLVLCVLSDGQEDLLTRGPYEFQFSVDDPETYNKYEIQESGEPDIVTGSYKINLPDGRTQLVSYQVHPERGYEATVTYEGSAQYPDSPNYVATPYGPPEPLRPGIEKFKRESLLLTELGAEQQRRDARKVELTFKNSAPNKINKKTPETKSLKQTDDDLSTSPTKVVLNEDAINGLDKKTQPKKKHEQKQQKKIKKKIFDEIPVEERDSFYDTHETPRAEPLSLQQNNRPKNKAKKTEPRLEYKPAELLVDLTTLKQDDNEEKVELEILTEKSFEDIADVIFTTDQKSEVELAGLPLIELISPPPTNSFIEKNHHKRKIDSKDFYQGNANVHSARNHLRYLPPPPVPLPTIYRSEISHPANTLAAAASPRHDRQLVGQLGTEQYRHLYQTGFGGQLDVPPPAKTEERKVWKIKRIHNPILN